MASRSGGSFAARYALTPSDQPTGTPPEGELAAQAGGFGAFMGRFAGCTFADGLYRLHDAESAEAALGLITSGFPHHVGRILPFGYDWLGSQFCLDDQRREGGEPLVLILEIGTGEALQVPANFARFHDVELVEHADAAVNRPFFEDWKGEADQTVLPLQRDQCVGYRIPLFLGGKDEVENLEVNDLEIYWELTGQALRQVR